MKLPDIGDLFDEPEGEFEKFLHKPVGDDPNYIDEFALVYARLEATKAQLTSALSRVRQDRLDEFGDYQASLLAKIDPNTDKRYSLEAAARKIDRMPSQRDYHRREAEMKRRIAILTGYTRAMDIKNRMIPGEQGRLNAWARAERNTSS